VTPARRLAALCLVGGALITSGCRSGGDSESSMSGVDATSSASGGGPTSVTSDAESGAVDSESTIDDAETTETGSAPPADEQSTVVTSPASVVEPDPDELVLSDAFADDRSDDAWDDATWSVDAPGEASATAINGVGVMETDLRGTHEWVRATAPDSTHENASLLARITPVRSNEGTVFIGLRGDGEWRDASPYMPQSGVVVEYGYAEIFGGELVLIVLDGPDEQRIGPAIGPILAEGESANIRIEVVDGRARAKAWRDGTPEPVGWHVQADLPSMDGGTVQISYRDGVGQSVAWDELTLLLLP
jgi:hypothetical protein